ncbi:hypothetical protein ACFE04_008094 [Oxalis oulophora]
MRRFRSSSSIVRSFHSTSSTTRYSHTICSGYSIHTQFTSSTFNNTNKPIFNPPAFLISRHFSSTTTNVAQLPNTTEVSRAGPYVEYQRRIAAGELVDGDLCQVGTLRELQRLYDELVEYADDCKLDRYASSEKSGRSRWLWSRFLQQPSHAPVKGLYLYGGVGTGKTMLMDLFYDQLPDNWRKKRIHFHDFMLNVHSRLQRHKGVSDPLEVVAGEISDEAILLCLDEFMAQQGFYFIGKNLTDFLLEKFQELIGEHKAVPQEVEVVMGRKLQIPLGANGCAYFPFEELCDRPLGAADYFGLFKKFHTLALDGIPIFGLHNRTAAYRFVTLVDVMYENKARLLCTAEGSPIDLFEKIVTIADAQNMAPRTASRSRRNDEADLCVDNELGFAKDRTISRLTELNSKEYLEQHAATVAEKKLTHDS